MSPIAITTNDTPDSVLTTAAGKGAGPVIPEIPPWVAPPVTKHDLDWADLEQINIKDLDNPDEAVRARLVAATKKALTQDGFLFITGTGVTNERLERTLAIAQHVMSIPREEKEPYAAKLAEGSFAGYKLRGIWKRDGGAPDNLEHYNLETESFAANAPHPPAIQPYLPELRAFAEHTYKYVVYRILKLISLVLELPEDYLWGLHAHSEPIGAACLRLMGYYPRSAEDEAVTKGVWNKGHTDYNSISILYSQPISALQILTQQGEWKWVRHVEGSVVVNTADALEFLSGGIFPSTRHRVIRPPDDQANIIRYILIQFARARRDLPLDPIWDSPLVKAQGKNAFQDRVGRGEKAPTQGEWLRERIKKTGNEDYMKSGQQGVGKIEEQVLGRKVEYYV